MQSNDIGSLFKQLRHDKGVSLRDVQDQTGVSGSYICKLEKAVRDNPSLYILTKLSNYYGIDLKVIEEICGNVVNQNDEEIDNLDTLILNEVYNFAGIRASIVLRGLLRKLTLRLEEYTTKADVSRSDEIILLDVIDEIREKMLEETA